MKDEYLHRYKEFHGLTLEEIARTTGARLNGYAVFMIPEEQPDDVYGELVDEGISVAEILQKNPEVAGCIVKYTNGYLGQIVLRVVKPAAEQTLEEYCVFCGERIQASEIYCQACAPIAESLEPDKRRLLEKMLADEKARAAFRRDYQRVKEHMAAAMRLVIDAVIPILERIAETYRNSEEAQE